MAHALVELHLDVFDSRLLEQGGRAFHAAPLVPHRVERAGDEKDRQLGGNRERRIERRDLGSKARERRVGASRERLAAQVVGNVGIDDCGIGGKPVERRARVFDGLRKGPVRKVVEQLAARAFPLLGGDSASKSVSHLRLHDGLVAGAANHGARKAFRMAGQVRPRDEASHGMPEDEVGRLAREAGAHRFSHLVNVLDEGVLPAIERHVPQVHRVDDRAAVSDVVVGAHRKAGTHKEASEILVAADVLGHAVDDLHDCTRSGTRCAMRGNGLP